jgi:hypothetical protein
MKMGKMTVAMLIGCGLMLAGVILLPAFGVKLGGVLPYLLIAACPLSHVVMMAFMGKGHDHRGHGEESSEAHDHSMHEQAGRAALPAPQDRV